MKKIVGTIAAVAVAAGVAFADVGIGSWGRAIFAPVASLDGETVQTFDTTSWYKWTNVPRVGITVHAESENVGFNIDMNADKDGMGAVGIHDTAQFWAKPWSWLEVKIGKTLDDTGRGNLCYGLFNWLRLGYGEAGEDLTFNRFGGGVGAIVKVTPVKGLWAIASIMPGTYAIDGKGNAISIPKAETVFGNQSQYGVGYEIEGIGHIRAQYRGGSNAKDKDGNTILNSEIQAAFDLTAVEGLYVTVGAKIPLGLAAFGYIDNDPTKPAVSNQVTIAAGADFKLDVVTLHAIVEGKIPNTVDVGNNMTLTKGGKIAVGVGADFDFGNGIGLAADIRFQSAQDTTGKAKVGDTTYTSTRRDSKGSLDFLVGLQKGLTNGSIGIGFEGSVLDFTGSNSKFAWAVPVVISASF